VSANQLFSAMNAATASRCGGSSQLAAFDAHQKGPRLRTAISRGHHVHVVSHQPKEGVSECVKFSPRFVLAFLHVNNWRGLQRSASFSRISHWLPSSSRADDRRMASTSLRVIRRNSPVRAVTGCAGAFHSAIGSGSRPAVGNTLADQQSVNAGGCN
jgi:hypothetical protein